MDKEYKNEKIEPKPLSNFTQDAKIELDLDANRILLEFRIDDIARKLNPGVLAAGHCGGCIGCTGCSM